jgi:ankyrin repeat protein
MLISRKKHEQRLTLAAARGKTETLKALLAKGVDANAEDELLTALQHAIINRRISAVKILLNAGADPNKQARLHRRDDAPLIIAVQKKDERIVEDLLSKNVHKSTISYGLSLASENGYTDIAIKLLAKGANPNINDHTGSPVLIDAIKRNDTRMAKILLQSGADPQASEKEEIASGTYWNPDAKTGSKRGRTALELASDCDNIEIAESLLEHGANPHTDLPLVVAVRRGQQRFVQLLLDAGVDPNKDAPLVLAAKLGNLSIVRLLVNNGASLDTPGSGGKTALMAAEEFGSETVVEFLKRGGMEEETIHLEPMAPVSEEDGVRNGKAVDSIAGLMEETHGLIMDSISKPYDAELVQSLRDVRDAIDRFLSIWESGSKD